MAQERLFPRILIEARIAAGMTQAQLAGQIGVSAATLASWETGRRSPGPRRRSSLIEAADLLGIPTSDLNALLTELGLTPVPPARLAPLLDRRKPIAVLQAECATYNWPTLAMNEDFEVIAWNEAANTLSELDFATDLAEPGARHLLRMALSKHYAGKLQNWDEVISIMVGMWKTTGFDPVSAPTPYFQNLMAYVFANHPAELPRLLALWENAPPHTEGQRVVFPADWCASDGTMLRFTCELSGWSDYDAVAALDWHPANAATWRWLEARRGARVAEPAAAAGGPPTVTSARELLRAARVRNGLTQRELADRAGISEDLLHSLEAGRRPITERTLLRLGGAMALNTASLNAILEAAGFEPRPSDQYRYILGYAVPGSTRYGKALGRRTNYSLAAIEGEIEGYGWPAIIVNERCEVVCANAAARRVMPNVLAGLGEGPERNLFAIVTDAPFREGARNWETAVANVLPGNLEAYMAPPGARREQSKDEIYFASVIDHVRRRETRAGRGDGVIRATFAAWRAQRNRRLSARVAFPLEWQAEGALLTFGAVIAPWDAMRDPYWAIELHPGDAETWEWLGK